MPGHGGADGRAVSDGNSWPKAAWFVHYLRLADMLTFCGCQVLLTRTRGGAICDDPAATLRQQKVSDTKKRVEIINSCADAWLISIHQNSLPGHPGVSVTPESSITDRTVEALALCIQNDLNMAVNTREKAAKRIDDSIYIMKHADCPAVLVECGFLSNPEETVLLQQPDYQLHMAAAIAAGFCQYCTNEG